MSAAGTENPGGTPGATGARDKPLDAAAQRIVVRPVCPVCGSRRVSSNGRPAGTGVTYRPCRDCGAVRKWRTVYADEVIVLVKGDDAAARKN